MRLSGFATGMDINQMVQDLMKAERMPMDRMKQDQQVLEWRMEEYRAINLKLDQFRNNIFDTVLRSANMMKKMATSSNSGLVTATATSAANAGTFSITSVSRLATAASNASASSISGENGKLDVTKRLDSQEISGFEWQSGVVNKKDITVDAAGKNFTVDMPIDMDAIEAQGDSPKAVVKVNGVAYNIVTDDRETLLANEVRVTDDVDGKVELEFATNLKAKDKVEVTTITEAAGDETATNYSISSITTFDANGNEIKDTFVITGNQTMNDVIRQMNASPTGINVFYDDHTDKISVIRKETGVFNTDSNGVEINFEGDFFTDGLKLDNDDEKAATNAEFTINGLTTERRSNTFTMNGVTMTLHETFEQGTNNVTIGAQTDVDSIMETIKGFVDEYNELVELVNGKTREEFYRDYRPLTEEQRQAMSDREIELWEEKAMSGLLRNDRTLRSGFDKFRMDMYSPVSIGFDSDYNQLSAIGITTTSNYRDGGKLEINEDKLREAIENDAEAVFRIFAGDGTTNGEKGVARRVRESANGLIEQISQRAGGMRGRNLNHQFTIGREMDRIEDRISNFERKMQRVEQRYWSQFTAMEKAVAQANSQGEALWAQLYGGGW